MASALSWRIIRMPVVEGFVYVAQGSRSGKENNPGYLAKFDPETGYAALTGSAEEMSALVEGIRSGATDNA